MPSIAIGLTGLVCLKRLLEQGFDAVGFEREAKVGGLWRFTSDTTKTSVLKSQSSSHILHDTLFILHFWVPLGTCSSPI